MHHHQKGKLILRKVSKTFPKTEMPILKDIDIECNPSDFIVFIGPSGCGKSTLLNIVSGMIPPDLGEVLLDGKKITGPGPDRSMVFQDHGLFPWLTAAENVEFGLKMIGIPLSEREDRVSEVLKIVHLSSSRNKLIHELSGGMRQRIALARSLVMDPAVLLMDEPFAALDAQTRTHIHIQLLEIWYQSKKTILFVTHSVGEAVRLATRVFILNSSPGTIRKEIPIPLGYPRDLDDPKLNHFIRLVRSEVEQETPHSHVLEM